MINPKAPCPNCTAMKHLPWCRKNCSFSSPKEEPKSFVKATEAITFEEAQAILRQNKARGAFKAAKPVRCTTTNLIYGSVAAASRATDVKGSDIIRVCQCRRTCVDHLKFEYITLEVSG